jgi:hypothetical protein
MMSKRDWHKAIDAVMVAVGATGGAGAVHKAIVEHQGKTYNKKLNIAMACGRCAATMYFGITKVALKHWDKDASAPPVVTCPNPKCGHTGEHSYQGLT